MASLGDIETLAKRFSTKRRFLGLKLQALEDDLRAVKRQHLDTLKEAAAEAGAMREQLREAVRESPELFVKPRSLVIHGVKVGFEKGKGKLEITDPARVVALIRKHHPDQADVLIQTTERPVAKALGQLTGAELKKLGVAVVDGGDQVVVRDAASEIDKLVDAMLAEFEPESA